MADQNSNVIRLEADDLHWEGVSQFTEGIRNGRKFKFSGEAEHILNFRFVSAGLATKADPTQWKALSRLEIATSLDGFYTQGHSCNNKIRWVRNSLAERMSLIEVLLARGNYCTLDKYVSLIWKAYAAGEREFDESGGVSAMIKSLRRNSSPENLNGWFAAQVELKQPTTIQEFCWALYEIMHALEVAHRHGLSGNPLRGNIPMADKKCDGCGNVGHIRWACPLKRHAEFNSEIGVPFRLSVHGKQRSGEPIPLPEGYVNPNW